MQKVLPSVRDLCVDRLSTSLLSSPLRYRRLGLEISVELLGIDVTKGFIRDFDEGLEAEVDTEIRFAALA
ncbi:hypothetical protein [Paraburkholderia ribeironis]|uniref:hypothetical protein n=1 Tax=Paraburkholderia ribeironis TaxID=1247936 RepID=UPI000B9D508C|nr:hypothetical protein [Paraburkholderia ribeironis]